MLSIGPTFHYALIGKREHYKLRTVVEHCTGVEKVGVELEATTLAGERAKVVDAAGVTMVLSTLLMVLTAFGAYLTRQIARPC